MGLEQCLELSSLTKVIIIIVKITGYDALLYLVDLPAIPHRVILPGQHQLQWPYMIDSNIVHVCLIPVYLCLTSVLRLSLAWASAIAHMLFSAELGTSELCILEVLTRRLEM